MPSAGPASLIRTYASFVKLSHTVFALPFALVGMAAAYAVPTGFLYVLPGPDGMPPYPGSFDQRVDFSWLTVLLILGCMVGARSFAMAVNRIIDRRIDALNPRTASRELPSGKLTLRHAKVFTALSALLYFGSCFVLGDIVFILSPVPILLMLAYPYFKRVTSLCHVALGCSLGLAPVGAWMAVRGLFAHLGDKHHWGFFEPEGFRLFVFDSLLPGRIDSGGVGWFALIEPAPWVLGAAVMLWVAGFDIIYALQDDVFDRANRLHSIPAAFGRKAALWISRAMHLCAAACFFGFIWLLTHPAPVGGMDTRQYTEVANWVWAAPCVMLAGLVYQHSLVKPHDLSRVNMAFFTVNGVISVLFGAVFLAAWLAA